jgi:hypothetical protein
LGAQRPQELKSLRRQGLKARFNRRPGSANACFPIDAIDVVSQSETVTG